MCAHLRVCEVGDRTDCWLEGLGEGLEMLPTQCGAASVFLVLNSVAAD